MLASIATIATTIDFFIAFPRAFFVREEIIPLQSGEINRLMPVQRAMHRRQRVFEAAGTIEKHSLIGTRNTAIGEALLVGRISRRALWAQQEAFLTRHFIERRTDRLIGHCDRESVALAHGAQDKKVANCLRHANA